MSYDWNKYLEFADVLYNEPLNFDDQTLSRNIISRAYYATHNLARILKYSIDNVQLKDDRDKHYKVINFFSSYDHTQGTNIADSLDSLRKKRGQVDYDENITFSLPDANLMLLTAQDAIEEMSRHTG